MKNNKRELLLSALLTHPTIKAAAIFASVPEATAYRWLRDPEFCEEYERRKKQAVEEAAVFLQIRISAATQIIDDIMSDTDIAPQTRLAAAKIILEKGFEIAVEQSIINRIELLEAAIAAKKG